MKMTKREKELFKDLEIGTENVIVRNPFSGLEVEVCPEAAALYNLIMNIQRKYWDKGIYLSTEEGKKINDLFYSARDVIIKNWPDLYLKLLD